MKFPTNYSESISLKTLAEGYCKSIENTKRLIEDGESLIRNKRYLGAINSLRLAIEELAKAHLINQAVVYKKSEKDKWVWFWNAFTRHEEKLKLLEYELHGRKYKNKNEVNQIIKALMQTREKSIYVHFDRKNKKFFTPKEIYESAPKIEDTARLELGYTISVFDFYIDGRMPTIKETLDVYKFMQKGNTN